MSGDRWPVPAGASATYAFALLSDSGLDLQQLGSAIYTSTQHRALDAIAIEICRNNDGFANWIIVALLTEVLIDLCRQQHARPNDLAFAQQVDQVLWTHMSHAPSRADIAARMYCSESQLARRYRSATGKSILQRLQELRLQRAETLLLHSDLSVRAVASELGLRCGSRFAAWFKTATGVTPRTWRQQQAVAHA
jgi:AraC-like DNA-binding protein